ncbi:MAG: hypothetical protein IT379_38585 [Deltaproteobacteria bacterium]|nr:hypothetical protein [Deltaproteobacteria bacterium]
MNRGQRARHQRTWIVLALVLAGALGWALYRRTVRPVETYVAPRVAAAGRAR